MSLLTLYIQSYLFYFQDIVIQCPSNDTKNLEEALKKTELVDWNKQILIPFAPSHIIETIKNIVNYVNAEIEEIVPSHSLIYGKDKPSFDIR